MFNPLIHRFVQWPQLCHIVGCGKNQGCLFLTSLICHRSILLHLISTLLLYTPCRAYCPRCSCTATAIWSFNPSQSPLSTLFRDAPGSPHQCVSNAKTNNKCWPLSCPSRHASTSYTFQQKKTTNINADAHTTTTPLAAILKHTLYHFFTDVILIDFFSLSEWMWTEYEYLWVRLYVPASMITNGKQKWK